MTSPTIQDVPQSIGAAWEVQERLVYHSQPGRFLAGLNVGYTGDKQVYGEGDLPILENFSCSWTESLFAGEARDPNRERKNIPVMPLLEIRFRAQFSRRAGLVRRNPLNAAASKGMLEWQALIMDAVERSRDSVGTVDAALCGYVSKPVSMMWQESEPSELALQSDLIVTLELTPLCRSERGHLKG